MDSDEVSEVSHPGGLGEVSEVSHSEASELGKYAILVASSWWQLILVEDIASEELCDLSELVILVMCLGFLF